MSDVVSVHAGTALTVRVLAGTGPIVAGIVRTGAVTTGMVAVVGAVIAAAAGKRV